MRLLATALCLLAGAVCLVTMCLSLTVSISTRSAALGRAGALPSTALGAVQRMTGVLTTSTTSKNVVITRTLLAPAGGAAPVKPTPVAAVQAQKPRPAPGPKLTASERAVRESGSVGHLPGLPLTRAPWGTKWKNSIALCTVMRDENITDVREWLSYYRWLGVDHVYLTENHSKRSLKPELQDFIDSSFLTMSAIDEPQAQLLVYRKCLQQHRKHYNWMAFFDIDEYLNVRDRSTNLKGVLNDYRYFPGVAVHWIFFGANDRTTRPEQGGVLRAYTKCNASPNNQIKMIANTYFIADIAGHPHNMRYRGYAVPVNEARYPVGSRYGIGINCTPGSANCPLTMGYEIAPPEQRSIKRLALFHYVTKSLEDFEIKARRGGGMNPAGKTRKFFDDMQGYSQTKAPLCAELARAADLCCARPTPKAA